jgi:predicted amidohydrolase YtcJ
MILLDRDIFTIPPVDIPDSQVKMTIVGGEIVYSANK